MRYPIAPRARISQRILVLLTPSDTRGSPTTPTRHRDTTTASTPNTTDADSPPKTLPPCAATLRATCFDPPNPGPTSRCSPTLTVRGPRKSTASCVTSFRGRVYQTCGRWQDDGGRVTPKKPRKSPPHWPHPAGQWAKKIDGVTYYFGRWADPDGAEEKYLREREDLLTDRVPREQNRNRARRLVDSVRRLVEEDSSRATVF